MPSLRIAVLDGFCLNPGDLSWEGIERFGEVAVFDRTADADVVARAAGAAIVLTNKTPLTAAALAQLPDLRYIGVLATGYNIVDVAAARARGVAVTNVPAYSTASVAQLVFALLLELCHNVKLHSDAVHAGEWVNSPDFSFARAPLIELAGKTMGIVGFGRTGRAVGRIADAMGMRVTVCGRRPADPPPYADFRWAGIDELLRQADVVSLHVPLFPETRGLIDARALALMKPTAFLINTSRGPVVVESDLAAALAAGRLAGAAVDVLSTEPPGAANPLLAAPHCLITPHIAWATREARVRLMDQVAANIGAFLAGQPRNLVN